MNITAYDKLIRDKIPQIIEQSGKSCTITVLSDKEYIKKLNEKLLEEVQEYLESDTVEELGDISDVIHAILEYKCISSSEFEKIRYEKIKTHGGFAKRILLKEVRES